jgi:hypothetical protein
MTFRLGNDSRLFVNKVAVSTTVAGYTVSHARQYSEVTTMANPGGTNFVPGLMNGALALRGPQDSVGQALATQIEAAKGVDNSVIATVCPDGTALGAFAMTILGDASDHEIAASVSDAVGYTFQATADESVDMGFLVHGLTAETATVNGTATDRGAATANGGVAVLHLTAYSGLTSVTVKVQDSADNVTFADLAGATFTTATAIAAERKYLAQGTAIRRYVRAVTTVVGTGSATFLVVLAPR